MANSCSMFLQHCNCKQARLPSLPLLLVTISMVVMCLRRVSVTPLQRRTQFTLLWYVYELDGLVIILSSCCNTNEMWILGSSRRLVYIFPNTKGGGFSNRRYETCHLLGSSSFSSIQRKRNASWKSTVKLCVGRID